MCLRICVTRVRVVKRPGKVRCKCEPSSESVRRRCGAVLPSAQVTKSHAASSVQAVFAWPHMARCRCKRCLKRGRRPCACWPVWTAQQRHGAPGQRRRWQPPPNAGQGRGKCKDIACEGIDGVTHTVKHTAAVNTQLLATAKRL